MCKFLKQAFIFLCCYLFGAILSFKFLKQAFIFLCCYLFGAILSLFFCFVSHKLYYLINGYGKTKSEIFLYHILDH